VNTVNNKSYVGVHKQSSLHFDGYIGCGLNRNINRGINKHPKTYFQRAVKKHGFDKFIRHTIAYFESKEEAYKMEASIVTYEFIKRKDTYNTALGGHGGAVLSVMKEVSVFTIEGEYINTYISITEAKLLLEIGSIKIDFPKTSEQVIKGFRWRLGNDTTALKPLTKIPDVILEARIGPKPKSEQKNNKRGYYAATLLSKYDMEGNFIRSYISTKQATDDIGLRSHNLVYALKDESKTFGGYRWRYGDNKNTLPPLEDKGGRRKAIVMLSKDGEVLKEFPTVTSASKAGFTAVTNILKGRQRATKEGYTFIYKKD